MRVWLLVVVVGCAGEGGAAGRNGASGADGQQGATGPAGPPGAPGGSYRWHDATGAQVTEGSELSVWADDLLWNINAETGELFAGGPLGLLFTLPDCEGTEYVSAFAPRTAVSGVSWGEPDELYVRPDTLNSSDEDVQSWRNTAGCLPYAPTMQVLRLSDLMPVAGVPSSGWAGPLHPEPIE